MPHKDTLNLHQKLAHELKSAKKAMFARHREGVPLREALDKFVVDTVSRFEKYAPRGAADHRESLHSSERETATGGCHKLSRDERTLVCERLTEFMGGDTFAFGTLGVLLTHLLAVTCSGGRPALESEIYDLRVLLLNGNSTFTGDLFDSLERETLTQLQSEVDEHRAARANATVASPYPFERICHRCDLAHCDVVIPEDERQKPCPRCDKFHCKADTVNDASELNDDLDARKLVSIVMSDHDTTIRGAALFTLLAELESLIDVGAANASGLAFDAKRAASSHLSDKVLSRTHVQLRNEFLSYGDFSRSQG